MPSKQMSRLPSEMRLRIEADLRVVFRSDELQHAGAFAGIYKAYHPEQGPVAVRVVVNAIGSDKRKLDLERLEIPRRYFAGADAEASHLSRVLEICKTSEWHASISRWNPKTLKDHLRPLDNKHLQRELQSCFGQLCRAFQFLRDRGFAYTDLKANNVMLDAQNAVRLIDLSSVCAIPVAGDDDDDQTSPILQNPQTASFSVSDDLKNLAAFYYLERTKSHISELESQLQYPGVTSLKGVSDAEARVLLAAFGRARLEVRLAGPMDLADKLAHRGPAGCQSSWIVLRAKIQAPPRRGGWFACNRQIDSHGNPSSSPSCRW